MKPKTAEKSDSTHPKRQNESTRQRVREAAFTKLLTKAQAKNLIVAGKPADLATRHFAILWDDLLIRLLMRLREPPTDDEIRERAHSATETLF